MTLYQAKVKIYSQSYPLGVDIHTSPSVFEAEDLEEAQKDVAKGLSDVGQYGIIIDVDYEGTIILYRNINEVRVTLEEVTPSSEAAPVEPQ